MAGITKEELSARRQRLCEQLPNHNWDYVRAGIAAGYSRSYAQTWLKKNVTKDNTFCQMVSAKRAEIDAQQVSKRERALRKLDDIINDENTTKRDAIRAIEVMGKICGWMSQTHVLETPERQRVLSEAQRETARRLALIMYDTRGLRDKPADWASIGQPNHREGPGSAGPPTEQT